MAKWSIKLEFKNTELFIICIILATYCASSPILRQISYIRQSSTNRLIVAICEDKLKQIMLNRYTDAFDIVNFDGSVYILQRSA